MIKLPYTALLMDVVKVSSLSKKWRPTCIGKDEGAERDRRRRGEGGRDIGPGLYNTRSLVGRTYEYDLKDCSAIADPEP